MAADGRPELLAPAGDPGALAAAIEAGADAVYLGLRHFSARARARNFTLKELERALALAHARDRRVHVALNTVVPEHEIVRALRLAAEVAARGADALIVQDLGLAAAIARRLPELDLHASTQLSTHNLEGVRALAERGFRRAILARELRIEEIEAIAREASIAVEIFIHGSLCFSISGLCLFSSFLGGHSGNRGWCTQPCRRPYRTRGTTSHIFSMADLCSVEVIGRIRHLPLAALKIEGRMKPAEHVARVVRAYRRLLDAPEATLPDAIREATASLAATRIRPATPGFLGGASADALTRPHVPGYTGRFLGTIERARPAAGKSAQRGAAGRDRRRRGPRRKAAGDRRGAGPRTLVRVHLRESVAADERLRVQFTADGTGASFRVERIRIGARQVTRAPPGSKATIEVPFACARGDLLFRMEDLDGGKRRVVFPEPELPARLVARRAARKAKALLRELDEGAGAAPPPSARRAHLTVFVPSLGGLRVLPRGIDRLLVALRRRTLHELRDLRAIPDAVRRRLALALPAAVFPPDTASLREAVARLIREGILDWEADNIGGMSLLRDAAREADAAGRIRLTTGPHLYAHNRAAVGALARSGARRIVFPLEGDERTLRELVAAPPAIPIEVVLFAYPALFTSRVALPLKGGTTLRDSQGERFVLRHVDDATRVHPDRPMCLLSRRPSLREAGIRHFRLDLTGTAFRPVGLVHLMRAYREGRDVAGSTAFNFDRGLR